MSMRLAKVKAALKKLGRGKNKIAQTLEKKKIQGYPMDAKECPVAKYLKKVFRSAYYIQVGLTNLKMEFTNGEEIDLALPKAVTSFIKELDKAFINKKNTKFKFLIIEDA